MVNEAHYFDTNYSRTAEYCSPFLLAPAKLKSIDYLFTPQQRMDFIEICDIFSTLAWLKAVDGEYHARL